MCIRDRSFDVGQIDTFAYSSKPLLSQVVSMFKEHRPDLAPGLETTVQPKPAQVAAASTPAGDDAANQAHKKMQADQDSLNAFARQATQAYQVNRRAIK